MVKAYPKYKNTRLPWLEKMPDGWQIKRGKAVFRCIDVRSKDGAEELLTVSSKDGVVPRSSKKITMFMAESYAGYKLCWPGDLVINSLWAWMFGLGFSRHHGIISSAYGVYRPQGQYSDYWKYFDYLFRSKAYDWELRVRSQGIWTSRLQLTDERFLDMPVLIPQKEEVSKIVGFLSIIDVQIRHYIRAKQQIIKLLNAQKQAIINKAVTRGIDSNVRLKPSEVDWLGDIPEHWEVKRIKHLARLKSGDGITSMDIDTSGTFPVYGGNGVRGYTSNFTHEGEYVLIGRQGALCGNINYANGKFWASEHAVVAFPINPYDVKWFGELLRTMNLNQYSIAAAQPGLAVDRIQNLKIPVPRFEEQSRIANFISSETVGLKQSVDSIQKEIHFLCEYRERLIYECVTGKIDVSDIKLPDLKEEALQEPIDEQEIPEDVEDSEEVVNADE